MQMYTNKADEKKNTAFFLSYVLHIAVINKNNVAKQESCIKLYQTGTPIRQIQKILHIGSAGTVYRILRRNGIELKSNSVG